MSNSKRVAMGLEAWDLREEIKFLNDRISAAKLGFSIPTVKTFASTHISDDIFEDLVVGDEIEGTNNLPYAVISIDDRDGNGFIEVISLDAVGYRTTFRPEDIAQVTKYVNNFNPLKTVTHATTPAYGVFDDELPYHQSLADIQPKCNCGAVHADWKIPHSDWCWIVSGTP